MKVLCCGNSLMGDDGFGPALYQTLKEDPFSENIEPVLVSWGGISILDHFDGDDKVIILDAMCLGAPPGTIHRFTFDDAVKSSSGTFLTTHNLNVVEAITVGRTLYPERMPRSIIFIGVEMARAPSFCQELSPEVTRTFPLIREMIQKEL